MFTFALSGFRCTVLKGPTSNKTPTDVLRTLHRLAIQPDSNLWFKMHQRLQFLEGLLPVGASIPLPVIQLPVTPL